MLPVSVVVVVVVCYASSTEQPMLDDLFIQDHYYSSVRDSHSQDDRYIVFRLQQSNHADKLSFERRSLFWYKMGEISRIVISIHMLFTGPSNLSADGKISAVSGLPLVPYIITFGVEFNLMVRQM